MESIVKAIAENDVTSLIEYMKGQNYNDFHEISINDEIFLNFYNKKSCLIKKLKLIDIAAIYNSLECFIYILNEYEIDLTKEYAPFHYCCICNSLEVATYLFYYYNNKCRLKTLQNIIEADYKLQQAGITLCNMCTNAGAYEILNILVKKYGYAINKVYKANKESINNAIERAIGKKYTECLKIILSGLNTNNSTSFSGSPLMSAIIFHNIEAVKLLLNQDDENFEISILQPDNPIFLACFLTQKQILFELLKRVNKSELININFVRGPIHWICEWGDAEVAKEFFKLGINPNAVDENSKIGLCYSTFKITSENEDEYLKIFRLMLDHSWDINQRNYDKMTPLDILLNGYYIPMKLIGFLLEHGAIVTNFAKAKITNSRKPELQELAKIICQK
ncbi:hypothetical protein TVAG_275860 [Trichomonas vaginalis G3]|uniref:Uncharacterized protein n=1 Tax=Trichomonas vaginalis (strain ATCC PRA-98 / G3) TaxID=412133 RepID=A2EYF9_TRIV3|nr:protein ubiquitination [Trichomonas vaginalis G3]EAY02312.1 hypothetical protein TVAG_275860 [Trichomonas vaginalis G3]KAI5500894.1 protein ubiquitination [Trichomonas vaginalis G3]|eukprot:XP_001314627.1 hypothetical protein [Trichomonas vaginalis G3]